MSFLKINDPLKRDAIVKEYLELKNRIRGNLLSERVGEQQLQTDLSKFYKPITETQKATTREITEGLKPISEGLKPISERLENIRREVHDIPGIFSDMEEVKKYGQEKQRKDKEEEEEEEEEEEKGEEYDEDEDLKMQLGGTAYDYLIKNKKKYNRDMLFGIHKLENGPYYLGAIEDTSDKNSWFLNSSNDKLIISNDNITVGSEKFIGTKGLWELIMKKEPDEKVYDVNDLENYKRLLRKTNVLHHDFNPENPHPRSSVSYKWENILSPIWKEMKEEKEAAKKTAGKGVVVISSDPNALLERLDLLLASQEAGHTGVRNELVSICDELKRQGVLDINAYKKLNHIIKK